MRNYQRPFLLLLAVLTLAFAAFALRPQSPTAAPQDKPKKFDKTEFESQFPVTDYDAPEPVEPEERAKRRARGKKHDNADLAISDRPDTITSTLHWATHLPALPVKQSQAVVVGEVVNAQAYLSNDKTGVYSEFTVRVEEVLKNDDANPLSSASTVVAERSGGRVKFPSGHITLQLIQGQGMPRQGRRDVLFLARGGEGGNYHIVTGYELRAGRVSPIDDPGGGTYPMTAYEGSEESLLLKDIRAAVANPLN